MIGGKPPRRRLDELLVERGLADTRGRAQALILAGKVFDGKGQRLDKPGLAVAADRAIELRGQDHPWVSRGGLKLVHGLDVFAVDVHGKICLDVGASTGGFTDVLLARGAAKVYAVDVGHGQLAWRLRQDARVIVLERTNARHLTRAQVSDPIDIVVCDASFIGLATVLPAPMTLAAPGAALIALIKPQFEVGRGRVGKGGIVRDPELHGEVCACIAAWLASQPGWTVVGMTESPIVGAEGNREFLICGRKDAA
jgi:23S rRNA (cytidine1920-2'-O)/16S rRNA (cytidine1409-2'-O)-methyltransferase